MCVKFKVGYGTFVFMCGKGLYVHFVPLLPPAAPVSRFCNRRRIWCLAGYAPSTPADCTKLHSSSDIVYLIMLSAQHTERSSREAVDDSILPASGSQADCSATLAKPAPPE